MTTLGTLSIHLDGGPCRVGIESTVLSVAGDTPVLLRRKSLSFLDSILILHLRQLLVEADTNDELEAVR